MNHVTYNRDACGYYNVNGTLNVVTDNTPLIMTRLLMLYIKE
jgi:hypothetical protein